MSDLLAKCDWHGDELRVELPQWPEVVTVCVNGKAMAYVPVVNDSKCDACDAMLDCDECLRADASHKELRGLQAENDRLKHELALETFRGAGEIEAYRRETSVAVKKAAQAEAENAKLRELCRHLYACNQYCDREDSDGGCSACPYQLIECDCGFEERLLEMGIEVAE